MATLARSAYARLLQACGADVALPEDGYPGEYLRDLMRRASRRAGRRDRRGARPTASRSGAIRRRCCARRGEAALDDLRRGAPPSGCSSRSRTTWRALAVSVDHFVSERALHAEGVVAVGARRRWRRRGQVYEADGARWFRSTAYRRRQGPRAAAQQRRADLLRRRHRLSPRQAAARLRSAHQRLGRRPPRLRQARRGGASQALGGDPAKFHVLIVQIVRLTRGGEPVRMGKRSGEFVTLREVRRRGRRRCDALLLPHAQERQPARVRPRPGRQAVVGEPGLLRAVRARAHLHAVQEGGGGGAARARRRVRGRSIGSASPRSRRW